MADLSPYLRLALDALGYDADVLDRTDRMRGTQEGSDVRRLAIALATENGATRKAAARLAGLTHPSSATSALRVHRDLVSSDAVYGLAWAMGRARLDGLGRKAVLTRTEPVLVGRFCRPGLLIHARRDDDDETTVCGLSTEGSDRLDAVLVGPLNLIGAKAEGCTLHLDWNELYRVVTCARCVHSLRS